MAVIVAKCPECGHEVDTDEIPQPLRLYVVLSILMVNTGMIHNVMQLPEYANAQPGWDEKLDDLTDSLDKTADEMEQFGEHYDG